MKKYIFVVVLFVITLVFFNKNLQSYTDQIIDAIDKTNNNAGDVLRDVTSTKTIGYGNSNFSTTPGVATIRYGILNVSGTLKNKTANKYEIRNFCNVNYGGYTYPATVLFPSDTNMIEPNGELEVEFEIDIHNIKRINIIPTEFNVELGTMLNNNYEAFDFKYTIAWGE